MTWLLDLAVLGSGISLVAGAGFTVYSYRGSPRLGHVAFLAASYLLLLIFSVASYALAQRIAGSWDAWMLLGAYIFGAWGLCRLFSIGPYPVRKRGPAGTSK